MTRCLLLGASGFIGGHVADHLAGMSDVDLVTAGRSASGVDWRLDLALAGALEISAVVRDIAPDVVINCAGATGADHATLVAANVVAVASLIEALATQVCPPRLVHLGSAAEYGPVPAGVPVTEQTATRPVATYGVSKLAGTALALSAARRFPVTVLRVFNPIGPGAPESLLPGRLMAQLRRCALTGEPATVGNLDGHRDFVDVRDLATAVVAAATITSERPRLLNVGSGQATALRELAAVAGEVSGAGPVLETANSSPRSAEVTWQCADITRARVELSWQPSRTLAESVRDMWAGSLLGAGASGSDV